MQSMVSLGKDLSMGKCLGKIAAEKIGRGIGGGKAEGQINGLFFVQLG